MQRCQQWPAMRFLLEMKAAPRAAFTLLELMIVLAIIAMLAGLLAINIRDGRERARATYCRNNLRQFGVAIGKYESDWDGYFIFPGAGSGLGGTGGMLADGGGAIMRKVPGSDASTRDSLAIYEMRMEGGVGTQLGVDIGGQDYAYFVNNYVRSGSAEKDVTYCPEVDMNIFDAQSQYFKGRAFSTGSGYYLDSMGQLTTYAINAVKAGSLRSGINNDVFAFIDWNAAQGWGAGVGWGTNVWVMEKDTVGLAVRNLYGDAGTLKGAPSYRTEIGFYHRSGTNRIANYVAMDGHVGSIASNAPPVEFQRLFGY